MTRDCGHNTGDDQRLRTFGERVPKFDRYPLPLPWSCPQRSLVRGPRRLGAIHKAQCFSHMHSGCPL
ncbi:unnamed protein product [Staurois parvus]|uniref:Uncharacterized protein n=1 Tax=Staurois parvus TaxID=386267 RepID=A0ABN9DSR8_9NEOB|nr:unnamed protein product [Staurois parvus]